MTEINGSGKLTFKWLASILLTLLFAAGGVIMAQTQASIVEAQKKSEENYKSNQYKIECLQKEKLDKDQYYRDMRDIKVALEKINDKLDKIKK